jgi:RNase H-like domain found in reverse transcriptase/Reverse transcriptase (RNA-dependent DNA polymerase)
MENHLQDLLWVIWMDGYAFWSYQWTCHFQCFMKEIFADLLDVCVVVYLDDILIYSNDLSSHQDHVKEVLWQLRRHNLFAHEDIYEFHRISVEFLGYNLSPDSLTRSDDKVKAIQDWPESRKVHDTQSFLGFTKFYWCFIHNHSRITIPLTHLTCKGTPWHFSEECHLDFNTLKKAFTSAPVLTHWIPDAPLIIETDASDYALAAILSLRTLDSDLHLVTFHSWTFTLPKLNYNVHDKELLVIFEAF